MQPPPLPPGLPPPAYLRPSGPSPDERTLGMLCHLLGIFTGFLGPLILWLVKKDSSPFVDHHGKEAVNFQISLFIITLCVSVVAVGLMIVWIGFLLLPLLLLIPLLALIFKILACASANRGEWHRYPMCLRLIP
ncbi:DUF4870 domain-containing protein [Luteolibacter luteus]|uniref:DUF4870 domain-containing protein n=1 Tax=Luteolibacter luteus TaxID=2728835 RepID=A0A858RR21_9BACT|nr:DUF4870 domain-containing protein [Luteolibacter luteus]QJE98570.1 DUF4870 domain-containing protein [Luteolibacter luteus]